jgi:hypothetical protein
MAIVDRFDCMLKTNIDSLSFYIFFFFFLIDFLTYLAILTLIPWLNWLKHGKKNYQNNSSPKNIILSMVACFGVDKNYPNLDYKHLNPINSPYDCQLVCQS